MTTIRLSEWAKLSNRERSTALANARPNGMESRTAARSLSMHDSSKGLAQ